MVGHCVQGVGPQLVVSQENGEEVELHPSFYVNHLVHSLAVRFTFKRSLLDEGALLDNPAQVGKRADLEDRCALQ